ncbi:PH domain-containing protein [Terribacillus saccharophilus]|uniref:PH domain-containing protein n=1 Tax=Terribacillus saccharophilus TaxID=361277 RepID=UPI00398299F4
MAHTVESIKERFKEVNVTDLFGTKKEVKELPMILFDDEIINYATSGFLDNNTWLIVVTNKRVLFLDKGMVFGIKQKEIPLEKINSISQKRGMLMGEIHIWDGAAKFQIKQVAKNTVQPFVDATNRAIDELKKGQTVTVVQAQAETAAAPEPSGYAKIKELKELLDMGAITQDEFETEKKKYI